MKLNPASQPVSSLHQPVSRCELNSFFGGIGPQIHTAQKDLPPASSPAQADQRVLACDPHDLDRFFADVSYRVVLTDRLQSQLDQRLATGFNVFQLIEPDENKLSDILADLLNPTGTHGQGDLFLRLLLERLELAADPQLVREATVQREALMPGGQNDQRRMDVFVKAGLLLAIENKVDSPEQPKQIRDYLDYLEGRDSPGSPRLNTVIYLTPNGRCPESLGHSELRRYQDSRGLRCWSYQDHLLRWVQDCRRECEAQRIRDFLLDFIGYIESDLIREPEDNHEETENDNDQ